MAYIWINPVTECMYEPKALTDFLKKYDYKQIKVSGDWLKVVKEKYRMAVCEADSPVMDMRCPKTMKVLDEIGVTPDVTIPSIEPILIHCAREISAEEDLKGEEKVITTPCQALADMGNALGLTDTTFITWNAFLAMLGDEPIETEGPQLEESPIPLGFFHELGIKTASVTGEDEIRDYFQKHLRQDISSQIQLVEILFCTHGCHNGDGIRKCKQ